MSGLILPGDMPKRGGLQILVPRGHETQERFGECALCEVEFGSPEDARRHFERNAAKHARLMEERKQETLEERMPIFSEESWDPEWAAHQRKVGQRMLREGRLVTRPNER